MSAVSSLPKREAAAVSPAGEFAYTDEDFTTIASVLYSGTGIHLPKNKAALVYSRLAKRLRALGLENFRDYCRLVSADGGAEERGRMFAALTTNVTRFFREPHHFAHLKTKVLPRLLEAAHKGKPIRLWSAGCSSGQEPYSMALAILSLAPEAKAYDIRILATDINPNVLKIGQEGFYLAEELTDVPAEMRQKWLVPEKTRDRTGYRFSDTVRNLIRFKELNLNGHWPMKGPFHAVFCRNVVIYFDEATQARIWSRMLPLLGSEARLYIGHSERVTGSALASLRIEATTTYCRQGMETS